MLNLIMKYIIMTIKIIILIPECTYSGIFIFPIKVLFHVQNQSIYNDFNHHLSLYIDFSTPTSVLINS